MTDDLSRIAVQLGLPSTATTDDIVRVIRLTTDEPVFLTQLCALTGTTGTADTLARVREWRDMTRALPVLRTKLAESAVQGERAQHLALMKAGRAALKIVGKNAAHCASLSAAELRDFLDAAPPVVGGELRPPEPFSGSAPMLRCGGKTWHEMKPMEKHTLFVDDRALYDAMKAEAEQPEHAA